MTTTGNTIIDNDLEEIISEPLHWEYLAHKNIIIAGANGMLPAYIVYTLLALNDTCLKEKKCKIIANVRNYDKAKRKFERFLNRDDFQLLLKDVSELTEYQFYFLKFSALVFSSDNYNVRFYLFLENYEQN